MFENDDDAFGGLGPAGLFAQLSQGFSGRYGPHRRNARQYDEYMKAYSVAMLPGKERTNVSYGGKIIMPPSALANLTSLDLESPWMFKLSNPSNPEAATHAGVLEFIAEEGCVHLPFWMMQALRLNEGDPIRITGTELPKGKFVKLQAQSVHFLEISDHKAVLEMALRNFAALTQGDIIQISYNSIVFDLLVMETKPGNGGINVIDTDLEVDFAAPVGYKEPERPKAAPPSTMASKLKIDLASSTPGSSRPSSALSGAFAGTSTGETVVMKDGETWESFKGKGETISGRKTKGRGISQRAIEKQAEGSKVYRTDKRRIVTADTLESRSNAPAPLNLPHGKLFFGFRTIPYIPKPKSTDTSEPSTSTFSGDGNTLSGRGSGNGAQGKGKGKAVETPALANGKDWGRGQALGFSSGNNQVNSLGRSSRPAERNMNSAPKTQRERSPTPDWGVDSDEEVTYIDSD